MQSLLCAVGHLEMSFYPFFLFYYSVVLTILKYATCFLITGHNRMKE
jgi:hypothetical protein